MGASFKPHRSIPMLKHLQAIFALPVMGVVVIPGALILIVRDMNVGWSLPTPFNLLPALTGIVLIGLGLTLMFKTISLFATVGQGTLAPWTPTKKLVVRGIYRYVRNPMISGVFCILLGEGLLFSSKSLLIWFAVFVVGNLIYMPLFEEPGLERRFGEDYVQYKKHVPRWIPRMTPWEAASDSRRLARLGGSEKQLKPIPRRRMTEGK